MNPKMAIGIATLHQVFPLICLKATVPKRSERPKPAHRKPLLTQVIELRGMVRKAAMMK